MDESGSFALLGAASPISGRPAPRESCASLDRAAHARVRAHTGRRSWGYFGVVSSVHVFREKSLLLFKEMRLRRDRSAVRFPRLRQAVEGGSLPIRGVGLRASLEDAMTLAVASLGLVARPKSRSRLRITSKSARAGVVGLKVKRQKRSAWRGARSAIARLALVPIADEDASGSAGTHVQRAPGSPWRAHDPSDDTLPASFARSKWPSWRRRKSCWAVELRKAWPVRRPKGRAVRRPQALWRGPPPRCGAPRGARVRY